MASIRARSWFFTYNNPDLTFDQFKALFDGHEIVKFVGQKEQGEEGTPHFQGVVQFNSKKSLGQLKHVDQKPHWEVCKSLKDALEYCTKEDTRIDGPWCFGWERPRPIERISMDDFAPWMEVTWGLLAGEPDKRKVHWFWEPLGNVGKTQFARKFCLEHNGLLVGGKACDIKHAVAKYVAKRRLEVVFFDIPRTAEGYVSYDAIECVKNGMFFSAKYDSDMCIFNSPHVVVFANFEPDKAKLSEDRWDIREISAVDKDFIAPRRRVVPAWDSDRMEWVVRSVL
jgi:hypothetical protein